MNKKYFYNLNYPTYEKELCNMEMKYIFGEIPSGKYIFSDKDIKVERSPFIKERIKVEYSEDTLDAVLEKLVENKLAYEDFKVIYIKTDVGQVTYKERMESVREVGLVVAGKAEMHNPKVTLGITKVQGKWIFGKYEKDDCTWHIHDAKPNSYSNSLGLRLSRALVNIAVGDNLKLKLVDPCCGVGTVVIDALSMDIEVKGFEINKQIARNAKENLKFFGYNNVITTGDMREIKEKFDVAIVDLPYGVFTPTTLEEQRDIITTSRRIADKLILVTFEDMDNIIQEAGFKIVDRCFLSKGSFTRWINICI